MSNEPTSNAVEQLYLFGKTILQALASLEGQQDDQWTACEAQRFTLLLRNCYSELVPRVVSLNDLKAVLGPVEHAGRNLLAWERNAPLPAEERRVYFNDRFLAFATCLDVDLTELRWTASNQEATLRHETATPPVVRLGEAADKEPASQSDPALSQRQYDTLQSLYLLNAFDADNLQTTASIAARAEGKEADPEQFKAPISDLRRRGLIATKEGRGGGCWLTNNGKSLIQRTRKL